MMVDEGGVESPRPFGGPAGKGSAAVVTPPSHPSVPKNADPMPLAGRGGKSAIAWVGVAEGIRGR